MRNIETALLVDDDHAFRTTLQSAFRRRGIRTRTAATVQEGLILLEDEPVDLVVLDHRLPQADGLSAITRYRDACPGAVIVMLTGHGDIPLAVVAMRRGADLFLTKPIEVDRLLTEAKAVSVVDKAEGRTSAPTLNLEEIERDAISRAMRQSGGVVTEAAKLPGIDRRTLQRKLRRMD
ncbi:MAG: DNA-binding response regulator [Deltaproteobacteria bacterium]|nr:DNA-binding response regulator [Deltaproteobacteria bacterium]